MLRNQTDTSYFVKKLPNPKVFKETVLDLVMYTLCMHTAAIFCAMNYARENQQVSTRDSCKVGFIFN